MTHRQLIAGVLTLLALVGGVNLAQSQKTATEKKVNSLHERGEHRPEPRSPMWPKVRAEHLKAHPECVACGQTDDLQVHHIVPFHNDPSKELDPKNLITLCVDGIGHTDCHLMFGHAGNFKCNNPNVVADAKRFREMIRIRACDIAVTPAEREK